MYTDFFENAPSAGQVIVRSSNGDLLVDVATGHPIELRCAETHGSPWALWTAEQGWVQRVGDKVPDLEGNYLKDIVRFDFEEWRRFHRGEEPSGCIDILDLGSWDRDGLYTEPESTWRADVRREVMGGRRSA